MRTRKPRRTLEWVKNLLIAVLALSAVYLALRTGLYTGWEVGGGGVAGWLPSLFREPEGQEPEAGPARPGAAARPVRMAVRSETGGRYGVQYDAAQTDALYDVFSGLLGEALSSAGEVRAVEERLWREALGQPGVYFDFLYETPLPALAAWLGEGGTAASPEGRARRLLLAHGQGDAVTLYYSNESDGMYYACETAVSYVGHLRDALEGYASNGATFVFEYGPGSGYGGVDPYVMVLSAPPAPKVYRGSNPVNLEDGDFLAALQRACGFPTQASAAYRVLGTVRVRDGSDALSIDESGEVTFVAGEGSEARYPADGADVSSLIEACRRLAQATVGTWCGGEARVALTGMTQREDGSWEITFGYLLEGAAVQLYDDGYAASFRLRDGRITAYTLRPRRYEDAGEQSLLLREIQAAAALNALNPEGRELALCYEDSGGETVRAGWVAR